MNSSNIRFRMGALLLIIFGLVHFSLELEINVTKFDNCLSSSGEEWPIEIQEVHYEYNDDGFVNQIHGTYLVRTIDEREKELTVTVYKCTINDPPPCEHKVEHVITELHCEKFRHDDSGIWYTISQAMSGSTCGDATGLFEFELPRLKHEYFEKYLVGGEQSSRYRMDLLFHKKNDESKDRRACAEINFDVYH